MDANKRESGYEPSFREIFYPEIPFTTSKRVPSAFDWRPFASIRGRNLQSEVALFAVGKSGSGGVAESVGEAGGGFFEELGGASDGFLHSHGGVDEGRESVKVGGEEFLVG